MTGSEYGTQKFFRVDLSSSGFLRQTLLPTRFNQKLHSPSMTDPYAELLANFSHIMMAAFGHAKVKGGWRRRSPMAKKSPKANKNFRVFIFGL